MCLSPQGFSGAIKFEHQIGTEVLFATRMQVQSSMSACCQSGCSILMVNALQKRGMLE